MEQNNRARGCLLGLAVGDAIGTTVEFKPRGKFTPMTDMVGGGPFRLKPGEWTDDTSMALCLANSLISNGFDLHDQISKYVSWFRNGYMSVNGRCFDIGTTTSVALRKFESDGNSVAGSTHPFASGNGGIMRLAPVPIMYSYSVATAMDKSAEQSSTTHASDECIDSAKILGEILARIIQGETNKDTLLISSVSCNEPMLQSVAKAEYRNFSIDDISGSGYVTESLEAALWCFYTTANFRDAVLKAVNLGDDADTTGAITGQVAGAYYGKSGIPIDWLKKLAWYEYIDDLAEKLNEKSKERLTALF